MTKQEVNRIIAEKLFGWKWFFNPTDYRKENDPNWAYGGCSPEEKVNAEKAALKPVPNYSALAELTFGPGGVVEKMRERFPASQYFCQSVGDPKDFHLACFTDGLGRFGSHRAPTPSEAVCFAAAQALEETNAAK